jgi:hypothetical protein
MGSDLRLRRFDSEQEDLAVREKIQSRAFHRRIFREMVKGEIGNGRLSWRQQKDLIQFAGSLGIDTYEAHLLLRAVEYECCISGPAAKAGIIAPVGAARLLEYDAAPGAATVIISLLTVLLIGAMAVRLLSALIS